MFSAPYVVTFSPEILDDGATEGVVRGYYTNETIAPDEKILVVEVVTDEEEVNELALVQTQNGWETAILTEDYVPYFSEGEPLDKIRAMTNMADAALANKIHPCMNGDIFGMGQMFTNENLSNFREGAINLELLDGPQLQTFLIANPLFEIAVGSDRVTELMGLCNRYDEVQSAYDAGKALWQGQVDAYRSGDIIAIYDQDAGTYDVEQGMYIGRTEDTFGRTEHIGLCSKGAFRYEDDWSKPINVAKSFIPYAMSDNDSTAAELSVPMAFRADLGWTPDPELIGQTLGLETYATSVTSLDDLDINPFQTLESEG